MRHSCYLLVHFISAAITDITTPRLLILFRCSVVPPVGRTKNGAARLHELRREKAVRSVDEETFRLGTEWVGILAIRLLIGVAYQGPYANELTCERRTF